MSALKYARLAAILIVLIFMPHMEARAQDDETPEQKRVMHTLMEREQIAVEERSGSANYVSPGTRLMEEKELSRAGMMKGEERDVTEEGGGYRGYWW
jgi:hypothetical protein